MKKIFILGFCLCVIGAFFLGFFVASNREVAQTADSTSVPKVVSVETTSKTAKKQTAKKKTKKASKAKETTAESTAKETESQTDAAEDSSKLLNSFKAVSQKPELPNGCEITSLTMVLNYYGFDADKCDLSDNYLDKGKVGTVDFRMAFEGNPRDEDAYGCYAPVIVNAANKYLKEQNSDMKAKEITDTEFENLFEYTKKGIPVMVWCTYDLAQGYPSKKWNVDGQEIQWYTPEHCMVLLGEKDGKVVTADPGYGEIKEYDKSLFETRYNELHKQSVIIEKGEQ